MMRASEIDRTLAALSRSSRWSVLLVLLGVVALAGMAWYGGRKVEQAAKLQHEIEAKRAQMLALETDINQRKGEIAKLEKLFEGLKAKIAGLSAIHVTKSNAVYEVKAMAKATGKLTGSRKPIYDFSVYINAPDAALRSIKSVDYHFDHPTFRHPLQTATNREEKFKVGYPGWGCLTNVGVDVHMEDGAVNHFDFDMCRSLGPDWGA
jgi:hypothetical protein